MLTTRPHARRRAGMNAWVTAICPTALTSSCQRRSSIRTNSRGPGTTTPALLTSPARPWSPTVRDTWSRAAAMESESVTSMITGTTPCDVASLRRSPSAGLRTPANTLKPRSWSRRAQASPMPDEVPVTTTAPRAPVPSIALTCSACPAVRVASGPVARDRVGGQDGQCLGLGLVLDRLAHQCQLLAVVARLDQALRVAPGVLAVAPHRLE